MYVRVAAAKGHAVKHQAADLRNLDLDYGVKLKYGVELKLFKLSKV